MLTLPNRPQHRRSPPPRLSKVAAESLASLAASGAPQEEVAQAKVASGAPEEAGEKGPESTDETPEGRAPGGLWNWLQGRSGG